MSKLFYPKLAMNNIKKNGKTYFPYALTSVFTTAMFYMICSLTFNRGVNELPAGVETVKMVLSFGVVVVAIFAAIFLFYTNSFLMKRRKKEFGLYNMLGMEKKHLCKVIGLETLYLLLFSLVVGLGLGILMDKAMFLLVLKMVGAEATFGFYVSATGMAMTVGLLCGIFLLVFLNSIRQIYASKTIELLQGGNVGEKEPKTKWVMAVLGALSLGAGYWLAVTVKNPVAAFAVFFVAVLLVIVGTYLLFTAGSVALLKLLRKNKRYYYRAKHFVSISGMLYRMKQNAVGLANICILSTMVLVMMSTTLSLWIGVDDIIRTRYPYDIAMEIRGTTEEREEALSKVVQQTQKELNVYPEKESSYRFLNFSALYRDHYFITDQSEADASVTDEISALFFMPIEDYNREMGTNYSLQEGEIFLHDPRVEYTDTTLSIFDKQYQIKGHLDEFVKNGFVEANIAIPYYIVVKDLNALRELDLLQKEIYGEYAATVRYYYGVDVAEESEIAFLEKANDLLYRAELHEVFVESHALNYQEGVSLYSGFLFLGIFLGLLFTVATILIIYYKQISEGYDDQGRFAIMKKVGMSHSEVKRAIHSQIITVFFLPLVVAGIHIAVAFPFMSKILMLLNMTNSNLYVLCTIGCFVVFAVLYFIIYSLTAKTYYRIVSQ